MAGTIFPRRRAGRGRARRPRHDSCRWSVLHPRGCRTFFARRASAGVRVGQSGLCDGRLAGRVARKAAAEVKGPHRKRVFGDRLKLVLAFEDLVGPARAAARRLESPLPGRTSGVVGRAAPPRARPGGTPRRAHLVEEHDIDVSHAQDIAGREQVVPDGCPVELHTLGRHRGHFEVLALPTDPAMDRRDAFRLDANVAGGSCPTSSGTSFESSRVSIIPVRWRISRAGMRQGRQDLFLISTIHIPSNQFSEHRPSSHVFRGI